MAVQREANAVGKRPFAVHDTDGFRGPLAPPPGVFIHLGFAGFAEAVGPKSAATLTVGTGTAAVGIEAPKFFFQGISETAIESQQEGVAFGALRMEGRVQEICTEEKGSPMENPIVKNKVRTELSGAGVGKPKGNNVAQPPTETEV